MSFSLKYKKKNHGRLHTLHSIIPLSSGRALARVEASTRFWCRAAANLMGLLEWDGYKFWLPFPIALSLGSPPHETSSSDLPQPTRVSPKVHWDSEKIFTKVVELLSGASAVRKQVGVELSTPPRTLSHTHTHTLAHAQTCLSDLHQ